MDISASMQVTVSIIQFLFQYLLTYLLHIGLMLIQGQLKEELYFYQETTNNSLLSRASVSIQNAFSTTFSATHLFIATWSAIGYYHYHTDKVHM